MHLKHDDVNPKDLYIKDFAKQGNIGQYNT